MKFNTLYCVRCVNECLKVSDESETGPEASAAASGVDRGVRLATPPSDKLVTITTNMNTNLTALLSILQVSHQSADWVWSANKGPL